MDAVILIFFSFYFCYRIYDVNFEAVDIFQTDASQLIRMLRAQQQIESRQQEQKEQQQKEQQQQQQI